MVTKNTKTDKLGKPKKFAKNDTSYSSFWLYNKERDMNSEHFKDSFVNFYNDKNLLSEFNPTVAKNIISFWTNQKEVILDPFAGRTRALVAHGMDRGYIGFEVSSDVINHMEEKFEELGLNEEEEFVVDIINDDCYNIDKYYDIDFDMIFSCPPYWNLEKYESTNGQLSDIKEYDKFLDALVKRLRKCIDFLEQDKYICLVVGDFRKNGKYIKFHSDLLQKMDELNNIKLHDVITIQNLPFSTAAFYFGTKKKFKYTAKSHEYLLVWKKIIKKDKIIKKKLSNITIEEINDYVTKKGGKCLSNECNGWYEKLKYQCKNGHKWTTTPYKLIKEKQWCPTCSGRKANVYRKLDFQDIKKLAEKRNGECLSKEKDYINTNSKFKWRCEHGHEWYASITSIKHGNKWCPYCPLGYRENFSRFLFETYTGLKFPKSHPSWLINNKTKRTLELDGYNEEKGIAFEYNGEQHYNKNKTFFHKNKEMYELQTERDDVKKQKCEERDIKLCIIPYNFTDEEIIDYVKKFLLDINFPLKKENIKVSDFTNYKYSKQEEFRQFIDSIGYELLTEYKHCNKKIKVKCKKGHVWEVLPRAIKNGNRCPYCSKKAKHDINNIRKKAEENNFELLDKEYKNNSQKLQIKCKKCGRIYKKRVIFILKNFRCYCN